MSFLIIINELCSCVLTMTVYLRQYIIHQCIPKIWLYLYREIENSEMTTLAQISILFNSHSEL